MLVEYLPRSSFLYDSIVIVIVGPTEHHFDLHKGLLCSWSGFFKAALNGNFIETEGTVKLPEQDPETFRYFVNWLYTGKLTGFHYPRTTKPTIAELSLEALDERKAQDLASIQNLDLCNDQLTALYQALYRDTPFSSLISLYILADVLQVPALRDPLISLLIARYGCCSSDSNGKNGCSLFWENQGKADVEDASKSINEAFEKLPDSSDLCRLLVDLFCDSVLKLGDFSDQHYFNYNFVLQVAQTYADRWFQDLSTTDWDEDMAVCKFHHHDLKDWKQCGYAEIGTFVAHFSGLLS